MTQMTARQDQAHTDDRTPPGQQVTTRRAGHVAELMERRPDLYGVYKPADVAADWVRWSA